LPIKVAQKVGSVRWMREMKGNHFLAYRKMTTSPVVGMCFTSTSRLIKTMPVSKVVLQMIVFKLTRYLPVKFRNTVGNPGDLTLKILSPFFAAILM
jgi:hypothetical protein